MSRSRSLSIVSPLLGRFGRTLNAATPRRSALQDGWPVLGRIVPRVLVGVLLVVCAAEVYVSLAYPLGLFRDMGGDYRLYMDATRRWLAGGSFYQAWQFAPYEVSFAPGALGTTAILYPPIALPVFALFTFLPEVLWYALPVGVYAYALWRHRPGWWAWVGVLACLAWPGTVITLGAGNPGMLMAAAVAAGTLWYWPAAVAVLKPTFAPFALFGIWRRSWWIAVAIMAALSLPFLPLWFDYVRVLLNAHGESVGLAYSVVQYPLLLAPVIAWRGAAVRAPRT